MKLRLYHYWRSSSSWRVRWGLVIKGISCEFVSVNLLNDETERPEHIQRNPLGFVPVLEFLDRSEGSDGGAKAPYPFLSESLAILEWLEETVPQPSLFSGNSFQKAKIRQLAELINSGTQPLQNPLVAERYSAEAEKQKSWNAYWIHRGLQAYETVVKDTAATFSVGNTLTLADLCLIPQCYNALRHEIPLKTFPTVERIYKAALATPSCQEASPERFKPME